MIARCRPPTRPPVAPFGQQHPGNVGRRLPPFEGANGRFNLGRFCGGTRDSTTPGAMARRQRAFSRAEHKGPLPRDRIDRMTHETRFKSVLDKVRGRRTARDMTLIAAYAGRYRRARAHGSRTSHHTPPWGCRLLGRRVRVASRREGAPRTRTAAAPSDALVRQRPRWTRQTCAARRGRAMLVSSCTYAASTAMYVAFCLPDTTVRNANLRRTLFVPRRRPRSRHVAAVTAPDGQNCRGPTRGVCAGD